jgi:hypothetical protein
MNDYGSSYNNYPFQYQGIPWPMVGPITTPVLAGTSSTRLQTRNVMYGNTSNDYILQLDASTGNTYAQMIFSQNGTPYWSIQGNAGQLTINDIVYGKTVSFASNSAGVSVGSNPFTCGSLTLNGNITTSAGSGGGNITAIHNNGGVFVKAYNSSGTGMIHIQSSSGADKMVLGYAESSASQGVGTNGSPLIALTGAGVLHITSGGTTDVATILGTDGTYTAISGNLICSTAGKGLQLKGGSNAKIGTGTLSSGTVTISNTAVTANSQVQVTDTGSSITNVGSLQVSSQTAGTGFTVNSTNVLDTSTFNYTITEKLP